MAPRAPEGLAFYAPPDPLPAGRPGELIWAEPVPLPGARAWRVLYHSRSLADHDIAVSGLVLAPTPAGPPGGYPVLAWAHPTTGLADRCAPSRSASSLAPLADLARNGYVVAATDYEGLGTPGPHPFLVGESEGRGVLDAARAARQVIRTDDRLVVAGHSQGGQAALFAGQLAPSYAPELRLLGVVGAAPATELGFVFRQLGLLAGQTSSELGGFLVAAFAGNAAAFPEAKLETVLTPEAQAGIGVLETGCLAEILSAFDRPLDRILVAGAVKAEPWRSLAERNSAGKQRTEAPLLVVQGKKDSLVVPQLTYAFVSEACGAGDTVELRTYPNADHSGVISAAKPDILRWIADRLAGRPAPSTCPR